MPDVGQPLPATTDPERRVAGFRGTVDDALDDCVEARDIAPAREYRDAS